MSMFTCCFDKDNLFCLKIDSKMNFFPSAPSTIFFFFPFSWLVNSYSACVENNICNISFRKHMSRNLKFFHSLIDTTIMRNFDRKMEHFNKRLWESHKLPKWKMIDELQNQESKNGIIWKFKRSSGFVTRRCSPFSYSIGREPKINTS